MVPIGDVGGGALLNSVVPMISFSKSLFPNATMLLLASMVEVGTRPPGSTMGWKLPFMVDKMVVMGLFVGLEGGVETRGPEGRAEEPGAARNSKKKRDK